MAVARTTKKKIAAKVPLEDDECKLFHEWLDISGIPHTHIPNESKITASTPQLRGIICARARKLKAMGMSTGFWDYDIFIPIKGVTGRVDAYQEVRVEMKRQKGGVTSDDQKAWQKVYEKAGCPCKVCKGFEDAKAYIEKIKKEIGE